MYTWQVDIYAGKDDELPYRRAIVRAKSESAAIDEVTAAMGDDMRADFKFVAQDDASLPENTVFWFPH